MRYHCHARNLGAAANFDSGVRSVDTPFFSILSDDDYLLPGFYQRALEGLAAHPEAMFWVGMTLIVDEDGTIWHAPLERWPRDGVCIPPEGATAMTGGLAPTWTGIVFRREVLDLAGFIDPDAIGPSDLDYMLRLGARFPYLVERVPVAVFTINSQGFSTTEPLSSFWPGWLKMFQNVAALPGLDAASRERLLAALHVDARRMLFGRAIKTLSEGRRDYARDAADVLAGQYARHFRSGLIRGLAFGCERIPGMQSTLSRSYRALEARIVRSRRGLQHRYAHLLQST